MSEIAVFADVSCPFAYVGLSRILAYREGLGPDASVLRVRSWPLEIVNGSPLTGQSLIPKVAALRRDVAPKLFAGFEPDRFPTTTLPALAAESAAYAAGPTQGMGFSLAVRRRLFEDGADIGDQAVVDDLLDRLGLPRAGSAERAAVERDHQEGLARGVQGSPHFFTPSGGFFCPSLDIHHDDDGYDIEFDPVRFEEFVSAAFG